jgi:hypothetical protein
MRINVVEKVAGTTFMQTVVASGGTISPLSFQLLSGSESLVNSTAGVSSGNGFYYGLHLLPTSEAWYIGQMIGVINTNTYVARQLVRARSLEVD